MDEWQFVAEGYVPGSSVLYDRASKTKLEERRVVNYFQKGVSRGRPSSKTNHVGTSGNRQDRR